MVSNVVKIDKNIATLSIEVSPEEFNKAINKSYNKNKKRFNISGFRKGKAPKKVIEMHYGEGVFYEDAIDFAFPDAYIKAVEENNLEPVARPAMENIDKISAEEGLVLTVSIAIKPEVELGEYKSTEIDKLEYEVTEEDINQELNNLQDQNSRLVSIEEGEAKEGDTVIIDFEGSVDGEPFEGGKAENYTLVLGSNTFIPGFESQLIGVKKDEKIDVNVTFPEQYQAETLAGKPAVFKVTVNEIKVKELPELDDEFVKDVSEFDTLGELKEDLSKKIKEKKLNELKIKAQDKVVKTAIENAKMEIPEPMIEEEIDRIVNDFGNQLKMQGINMEEYFKYTNVDETEFRKNLREEAENRIKTDLVLTKITDAEKIEATDEEADEEINNYAKMYNQEVEKLKESIQEGQIEYFKSNVKRRKTIDFLLDNAVQS